MSYPNKLALENGLELERQKLSEFIRDSDFIPEPQHTNFGWPAWLKHIVMNPNASNNERLKLFVFLYRNGVGSTELIRDIMLWFVRRIPQAVDNPDKVERHVNELMDALKNPDRNAYNRKQKDMFDSMTCWSLTQRKAINSAAEQAQQQQHVDLPRGYQFSEDLELYNAYDEIMNAGTDGTYGPDYWMLKAYDDILRELHIRKTKIESSKNARKASTTTTQAPTTTTTTQAPATTSTPDTVEDDDEELVITLPATKEKEPKKKLKRY